MKWEEKVRFVLFSRYRGPEMWCELLQSRKYQQTRYIYADKTKNSSDILWFY